MLLVCTCDPIRPLTLQMQLARGLPKLISWPADRATDAVAREEQHDGTTCKEKPAGLVQLQSNGSEDVQEQASCAV